MTINHFAETYIHTKLGTSSGQMVAADMRSIILSQLKLLASAHAQCTRCDVNALDSTDEWFVVADTRIS